jgi:DNA-binding FadR family transcriptional regulator
MEDSFKPIKKTRVAESLALEIKQKILRGSLSAGDKLPSEREMSKQCSTSRITVREAFRLLENEGLLLIKQGVDGGAFITETSHKMVEHSLHVFFKYGYLPVNKLTETRIIVEPEVAKLAAVNRSEGNLKELEEITEHCRLMIEKGKIDPKLHLQFHYLLARASQNPLLMAISNALISFLGEKLQPPEDATNFNNYKKDQEYHQEILLCVKKENAKKAYTVMKKHIEAFSRLVSDQ